ncbi:uncharacterized protein LOC135154829 isoform X1 [Lytechinus pictus]|uniref:uncharacterized protein LOC135154829 isoform X1 n=1 Tax=Lytechinus pictus TaxID=7653 RepID=UPI0030B9CA2A
MKSKIVIFSLLAVALTSLSITKKVAGVESQAPGTTTNDDPTRIIHRVGYDNGRSNTPTAPLHHAVTGSVGGQNAGAHTNEELTRIISRVAYDDGSGTPRAGPRGAKFAAGASTNRICFELELESYQYDCLNVKISKTFGATLYAC